MEKNSLRLIAFNSIFLYLKTIFTTITTLISVRLIIIAFGLIDFGIYTVVAGFVSIFALFSQSMSMAVQRFYSYHIGKNETLQVNKSFNMSLVIFISIAFLILILGETVGIYLIKNFLNIPIARYSAAISLYHFSLLAFFFTVISVPFTGMMLAKESILLYSSIGILDSTLKLIAASILLFFTVDRLSLYGILFAVTSLIITFFYIGICYLKYLECKLNLQFKFSDLKEMLNFSSWSFFGIVAGLANNQGNNLLINLFFSPVINASRGIAFQINGALNAFSNSLFLAVRPQMIKSFAAEDLEHTMKLFYLSSKVISYLLFALSIPIFLNLDFILKIWLGEYNTTMVLFSKLTLIFNFIFALQTPITTIIHATGKLKMYHILVESIILLSLPLTYFSFKLGSEAYFTFIISIMVFLVAHFVRLYVLSCHIAFSVKEYLTYFFLRTLTIMFLTYVLVYFILHYIFQVESSLFRLIVSLILNFTILSLLIILFGLNVNEKNALYKILNRTVSSVLKFRYF